MSYSKYSHAKKRSSKWLMIVAVLVVAAAAVWQLAHKSDQPSMSTQHVPSGQQGQNQTPKLSLIDLQPTVDEWLTGQSADFGIVVYDPANQQIVAAHNPDKKYFAASLYKLFVAYLALVDFQTGKQNPDQTLTGGYTRKECVDKMIRESHSPCGEVMMASMGQETLRQRISDMGIANTTFAGITTTARDSMLILQYVLDMRDLNVENTTFLKNAMSVQDQRFRNGLAKGAPEATWETKVGWNEQINYHDVGIMTLPNGRQYIVAVLSQNNGKSAPISDFAATIYTKINAR